VPSRFGSRRARGVTSQVVERGGEGGLTVGHHVLIAQRHAWVQALIIARDMGASRLGSMIEEKLHGSPVVLSNGDRIEIPPEARYWAKEFEKALGAEINL
jgi:hypothetical protein